MASSDHQQTAALFYCRFYRCPLSGKGFTERDFIRHANLEHADNGPEYRRDQFHDIFDEILSTPNPGPYRKLTSSHDSTAKEVSSQTSQKLPSSLPTPPVSEAASSPHHVQQIPELPQDTGVDPNLLSAPAQPPPRLFSGDDGQFRMSTPSFRDLSSPGGSPYMADNPGTPDFDAMIDDAIHPRKRQRLHLSTPNLKSRNSSLESNASNGSCFSVEQHLTQSLDSEEDADMDAEWQLSDLIRPERLDDMVLIDNPVLEQSTVYQVTSSQAAMPIITPVSVHGQSQPISTQGSAVYAGEIFRSQMPASIPPEEQTPTVKTTSSQLVSIQAKVLRDTEVSVTLSSSNISMPPPAQPRRPSPSSQNESILSAERSKSADPTPDPFFSFSFAGSSARQPFYPLTGAAKSGSQSPSKKAASATRAPQMTPKHRRKTRPRNPRGISGSFDLVTSQPRQRQGSPLKQACSVARRSPAPKKAQVSMNSDHDFQNLRGELDFQDDETLPPIMTQAPYETQDF